VIDEIIAEMQQTANKTVEAFSNSLNRIRTGRASLALLDGIKVNYYGAPTPLKQVASLSIPEARLIVIQPWDNTILADIEKAIMKSDVGITPNNDGKLLRLSVPPLTEERRKDLIKKIGKMGEESKVSLRHTRREANDQLKMLEDEKEITEDDNHKGQDKVKKVLDEYINKIDEFIKKKEKEILEF